LRFFQLFTSDTTLQVIGLRLINISFIVGGLVYYKKALCSIGGAPKSVVNIVFLFLIITPVAAILPGSVNYDNLTFLLFAIFLLNSIRVIKSKKIEALSIMWLLILGLSMSIIKWTSIALILPAILYICFDLYIKHRKKIFSLLYQSLLKISKLYLIALLAVLALFAALFIERPLINIVEYGDADPDCAKVIGRERCLAYPDYAIYDRVAEQKPINFSPINPVEYLLTFWVPGMINTQVSLLPREATIISPSLPIVKAIYFIFALTGSLLVIAYIREYLKSTTYRFLIAITLGYVTLLFMRLYGAYEIYATPAAISGRYLIPILPIFFYFIALSIRSIYGRHKKILLSSLLLLMVIMTQGGGIVTQSLSAQDRLYWNNSTTKSFDYKLRTIIHVLVKENM